MPEDVAVIGSATPAVGIRMIACARNPERRSPKSALRHREPGDRFAANLKVSADCVSPLQNLAFLRTLERNLSQWLSGTTKVAENSICARGP